MSPHDPGQLALAAAAGAAMGTASLAALRLSTRLFVAGAAFRGGLLHLLRLVGLTGALALVAHSGAAALLAALAGLTVARPLALRLLAGGR